MNINTIKNNMGLIPTDNKSYIYLEKFKIVNKLKKITFKSIITINNKKKYTIEVNKPLIFKSLNFYQNSWQIGIKKLIFLFYGKTYNVFKIKKHSLKTKNRNFFYFIPIDMDNDHRVNYKWIVLDKNSKIIDTGNFIFPGKNKVYKILNKRFGFKILQQDFKFITVLDVFYKPLNNIIGILSVLFLFFLGIYIFRVDETIK